jgi:hypothetical protein
MYPLFQMIVTLDGALVTADQLEMTTSGSICQGQLASGGPKCSSGLYRKLPAASGGHDPAYAIM